MDYLSDIEDINKDSIAKQSTPDSLVEYYSCNENKDDRQIGLVYITPYQVMQIFLERNGILHEEIAELIENQILNNQVQTRLFLRCGRRYIPNSSPISFFSWDVFLSNSSVKVKEITKEMYSVASEIQKLVIDLMRKQGEEIDEDFCILLDDAIEYNNIEIADNPSNFVPEPIYGCSLNDYSHGLQTYMQLSNQTNSNRVINDDDAR